MCVSLCVAILSILLPPSLSVPSTSSVPKNQHQHHQRHDSNDHNNVIWCPMPTLAKNNTLLWKDINNTVHCPYPVILTSPRIDSYAVFKQKICTVHTQHSMLLRAIYKEHKHILPADAHFNSPMWVGYGLLLWSIRHLRPKLFDALWLEFGVASTASTNLTAHAQRYNCGEVLQQQQQGEGEGEGSKEGFVTSCETPPLAPIIGFDSFQGGHSYLCISPQLGIFFLFAQLLIFFYHNCLSIHMCGVYIRSVYVINCIVMLLLAHMHARRSTYQLGTLSSRLLWKWWSHSTCGIQHSLGGGIV